MTLAQEESANVRIGNSFGTNTAISPRKKKDTRRVGDTTSATTVNCCRGAEFVSLRYLGLAIAVIGAAVSLWPLRSRAEGEERQ